MNGDEVKIISNGLSALKATVEERWKAHDKRSEDIWGEMREDVRNINSKLDNLPCASHIEKLKSLGIRINWIYGLIGSLIILLVGIWLKNIR